MAYLKRISLTLICFILFSGLVLAGGKSEKYYQLLWCEKIGGKPEVVLSDKTRCDCLTSEYAIENDFGKKWAESVGQALYYGAITGKKPGIALIVRLPKDQKYIDRINLIIEKYKLPIKIWVIEK